jgi:hypothetical protein
LNRKALFDEAQALLPGSSGPTMSMPPASILDAVSDLAQEIDVGTRMLDYDTACMARAIAIIPHGPGDFIDKQKQRLLLTPALKH